MLLVVVSFDYNMSHNLTLVSWWLLEVSKWCLKTLCLIHMLITSTVTEWITIWICRQHFILYFTLLYSFHMYTWSFQRSRVLLYVAHIEWIKTKSSSSKTPKNIIGSKNSPCCVMSRFWAICLLTYIFQHVYEIRMMMKYRLLTFSCHTFYFSKSFG